MYYTCIIVLIIQSHSYIMYKHVSQYYYYAHKQRHEDECVNVECHCVHMHTCIYTLLQHKHRVRDFNCRSERVRQTTSMIFAKPRARFVYNCTLIVCSSQIIFQLACGSVQSVQLKPVTKWTHKRNHIIIMAEG